MLEFLIDNIFGMFGGPIFQQTVGIHMGTNYASLLTDLFLYSYEVEFILGLFKKTKRKYPDPLISRSAIKMMSFH